MLQICRLRIVVVINERNIVSLCRVESGVAPRADVAAFAVDDADASIHCRVLVRDHTAAVGRSVVHNDKLKIAIRLRKDTLNRSRNQRLAVIGQHNDRYHGQILYYTFLILQTSPQERR